MVQYMRTPITEMTTSNRSSLGGGGDDNGGGCGSGIIVRGCVFDHLGAMLVAAGFGPRGVTQVCLFVQSASMNYILN